MAKIARDSSGYTVSVRTGSSPNAAEQPREEEFSRFESLAAKLVKVPKSELDEKLDESASAR